MFFPFVSKALAVTINPNIPGTNAVTAGQGPGAFVANFYQFALLIAGILALGAIVYGGVKYSASAGNPSAQSDGKEWVLSALYGLILLAGAYLILYTINPNLTNLSLPVLQPVNVTNPSNSNTLPSVQCGNQTCINALCLTNGSGQQYCQQMTTSSTNSNPACTAVPNGCTLYNPITPAPSGCPPNMFPTNCSGSPAPSLMKCYTQINC